MSTMALRPTSRLTTVDAKTGGSRWHSHRFAAELLRSSAVLLPIGASVGFVWSASQLVPPPAGSLIAYLGWWLGLSVAATLVLVAVGRITRRLLPLAALLRLSLVFPDGAPSRFSTALQSGTVKTLEQRLAEARQDNAGVTTTVAAHRLLVLVAALESHDSLTRGHSERVRAYAQMIGQELRLQPHELDLLNWAALLHDVGKLEIPTEILTKKGRPTESEWAAIRRHPELGEKLVAPLRDWLGEWSDAVGYHHERWDGGGYPRGVAGADIPLAGRIVAVADAFDVITSSRSYKQASGPSAARGEMARCAGAQFDPEIVRALLAISLGRHRFATGPLAWLADAAVLARIPLLSTTGTVAAAVVVAAAAPGSSGLGYRVDELTTRPISAPITMASSPPPSERSGKRIDLSVSRRGTDAGMTPDNTSSPKPRAAAASAPVSATEPGTSSSPEAGPSKDDAPGGSPAPAPSPGLVPPTTLPPPVIPTVPSIPVPLPSLPATPQLPSLPAGPSLPAVPQLPQEPVPSAPPSAPVPVLPTTPPLPSTPLVPALPG